MELRGSGIVSSTPVSLAIAYPPRRQKQRGEGEGVFHGRQKILQRRVIITYAVP
jgi:hypothetical protein